MIYPYDGVRASIEYYNNYIDYLKEQLKVLQQQNEQYLKLLSFYMQTDEVLANEVEKVKKIGEKR